MTFDTGNRSPQQGVMVDLVIMGHDAGYNVPYQLKICIMTHLGVKMSQKSWPGLYMYHSLLRLQLRNIMRVFHKRNFFLYIVLYIKKFLFLVDRG